MCMFVYVCMWCEEEGGGTSACMCGEVWDLVMP